MAYPDDYGITTPLWASVNKARIEFKTKQEAVDFKSQFGGWIVITEDNRVFWYSFKYTMTMIMNDLKGGIVIHGTTKP